MNLSTGGGRFSFNRLLKNAVSTPFLIPNRP